MNTVILSAAKKPSLRSHRRGFSMAEILVVVGILALLASISVFVASKARKSADKQRLGFQLQTITQGLEAYQTEFNSYPVTTANPSTTPITAPEYYINQEGARGARTLCKALMGQCGGMNPLIAVAGSTVVPGQHQDGKVGLGFAVPGRSGIAVTADNLGNLKGKTYGPYIAADKFVISNTALDPTTGKYQLVSTSLNAAEKYDDTAVLLDGNGNPILYWPCLNPQAPLGVAFGYISQGRTPAAGATTTKASDSLETGTAFGGTSMYSSLDNSAFIGAPLFRLLMGDVGDPAQANTKGDFKITGSEVAPVRGKFILWSAGTDGFFGPNTKNGTVTIDDAMKRPDLYDDVTNFQGQ